MLRFIITKTTPASTIVGMTRIQSETINHCNKASSFPLSRRICIGIWMKIEESQGIMVQIRATWTSFEDTAFGLCQN